MMAKRTIAEKLLMNYPMMIGTVHIQQMIVLREVDCSAVYFN